MKFCEPGTKIIFRIFGHNLCELMHRLLLVSKIVFRTGPKNLANLQVNR